VEIQLYSNAVWTLYLRALSPRSVSGGDCLGRSCPPDDMKPDAYRRIAAHTFDVALSMPFSVSTSVGPSSASIRTLEKQIRRLKHRSSRNYGVRRTLTAIALSALAVDGTRQNQLRLRSAACRADEYTPRLQADIAEWAKDFLAPAQHEPNSWSTY